jgi:hypothetical protein
LRFGRLPRGARPFVRRILRRLALCDGLLQILQPKLQLVMAQLLGSGAKMLAQQALDQQSATGAGN